MNLIEIAQEIGAIQLNMEQFTRYPNRYISLTNTNLEAAQYLIEAALGATYEQKSLKTGGTTTGSQEMVKRIESLSEHIEKLNDVSGLGSKQFHLLGLASDNILMAGLWLKHYKEQRHG